MSPIVEVVHSKRSRDNAEMELKTHSLRIPHCLANPSLVGLLRVRRGKSSCSSPFELLPHREEFGSKGDCYSADDNFITISAKNFSQFVCTSCNTTCQAIVKNVLFANLRVCRRNNITTVLIKSFLCSPLFRTAEFRNVSRSM